MYYYGSTFYFLLFDKHFKEKGDIMSHTITVALAGNPNIGKTTLLNALTGSRYSVGNWAGVTVEKKEAHLTHKNQAITLVDLPGTYSLSAYSLDESIARNYIVTENPDIILNIVDASNLERNLYLTLQLLELGKPVILALNMMDSAKKKGISIDLKKLSSTLKIPVVPIIAAKGTGLNDILNAIVTTNQTDCNPKPFNYNPSIETLITDLQSQLTDMPSKYYAPNRWLALKLLEGDTGILETMRDINLNYHTTETIANTIIDEKYEYISQVVSTVIHTNDTAQLTASEKIDRFVTHKWLGIPIFALIMFSIFYFTFTLVGDPLKDLLSVFFTYVSGLAASGLSALGVASWLQSLILDGILNGVFGVLTFLPNIACLFIALTILEDSGYMARVAFIMDQIMKRIGLNGKAIIPMLLGFGCSVPAIMGARTLEDEKDRLTTILINPFISCSARLPIYTLFAAAFFPGKEAFVIFTLYMLGIVVAILVALIFKRTLFKSEPTPFIMELPPYHMPSFKNVWAQVWDKLQGFLIKAGTIIFAASAILWFLLNFNFSGPSEISASFGAMIGGLIAPIFTPLGFGTWQASLSLLAGITAKEVVVSNMLIIYGLGDPSNIAAFHAALAGSFTPLSAYSFLVFCLLYVPCVATIGTIRRETNSLKWTLFSVFYQTGVAWLVSFAIYSIGKLFGF